MRYEKAELLLQLARRLASSAEGLTLDEMAEASGVGRRTAERMRDALYILFPQMDEWPDGPVKRFRIPQGLDAIFQTPTTEELAELGMAGASLRASGATARAEILETLERKVTSAIRTTAWRKIAPDLEALVRAEAIAVQAGPRPFEDPEIVGAIRHALVAMRAIAFRYEGGRTPGARRTVAPYGLMFGRANYLVAAELGSDGEAPRNWRLDRIFDLEVLDRPASVPEGFHLQDYAHRSFGIFQDEVQDVVLRIGPAGAEEARLWRFHPTQEIEDKADGSVVVRFRASGMRELAWHLFTWRDQVEILQPAILRETMLEELKLALSAHDRSARS
ncbi:helix-turn-helix transcriptional regulator [Caulobacter sp. KR2-114]|uniref:helix-turn-helix transcriptional regulator n=1 Tax=Caulobacter sp. KR2-114 TaxID=3400912 RepID=UPI003C0F9806